MEAEKVEATLEYRGRVVSLNSQALKDRAARLMRGRSDLGPDERYWAPISRDFRTGEEGEELDYLPAPDLETIAKRLIRDCSEFSHLVDLPIAYLWRKEGGSDRGKAKLGMCTKPGGLLKHFCDSTWVIWLAADVTNLHKLTRRQVEAALYHELLHAGEGIDGVTGQKVPKLAPHDIEAFGLEISRYGAWKEDLKINRDAWLQAPLPVRSVDKETGEIRG